MTEINEKIVADTPYSVALDGIERRLRALKNRVRLTVPLQSLGLPAPLALEAEVDVEFVSVRGGKGLTQLHDEMTIHWLLNPVCGWSLPSHVSNAPQAGN